MIIDCHTHITNQEQYRHYLRRGGSRVDKIITIHDWDLSKPTHEPTIDELLQFASTKSNLFVIASVDMTHSLPPQLKKLDGQFRRGEIIGVKLYPGYQPFFVSDEKVNPIATLCAKYQKPLVIHMGDVYDPHGTARMRFSHPISVDELAVRHPDCPLVIAHFGFPYILETANIVVKNTNVYTDISATLIDLPRRDAKALLTQFAADLKRAFTYFPDARNKVLFGTDYAGEHTYLNQVEPYFAAVQKLFRPSERKRILGGLAEELFFSETK